MATTTYNYYGSYTIGKNAKSGRSQLQVVVEDSATSVKVTLRGIADRKPNYTLKYGYKSWLYLSGAQVAYKAESSASNSYPRTLTTYSKTYTKGTSAQSVAASHKLSSQWTSTTYTSTASGTITIPALASYVVSFNANGGSGAPASQTKYYGKNLTLSATVPTRTNYRFLGWGTSADATSPSYQPGGTYTGNAALSLYAIWVLDANIAYFDAAGGTCDPSSVPVTIGSNLLQADCPSTATKLGYTFTGWLDPYGDPISGYYNQPLEDDVTFTAQYTPKNYTIYVEANGGSGATSFTKAYGSTVTQSDFTAPTKSHSILTGYEVYIGSSSTNKEPIDSFDAANFSKVMNWVEDAQQTAVTFKPLWDIEQVQLSFVDGLYNYDVSSNNADIDYGTSLTSDDLAEFLKPVKVGYICTGWSTTQSTLGAGTALTSLTVTSDTTLYAVWEFVPTNPTVVQGQTKAEWAIYNSSDIVKVKVTIAIGKDKTGTDVTSNTISLAYTDDQGDPASASQALTSETTYTFTLYDVDLDAVSITATVYQTSTPSASNTYSIPLRKPYYPIDVGAEGKSIAFGGNSEDDLTDHPNGLFECFMDAKFNANVFGIRGSIIGEIKMYAGATIPTGWLDCDGSEVAIADYPLLYDAIGDTWGTPSDSDHFVLPNMKGRFPIGVGSIDAGDSSAESYWGGTTAGAVNATLGQRAGEAWHTLNDTQIPAHTHGQATLTGTWGNGTSRFPDTTSRSGIVTNLSGSRSKYFQKTGSTESNTYGFSINASHTHTSVGGGKEHNNMPPFSAVNFIICAV